MNPNPKPGGSREQILADHRQIGELLSTLAVLTVATETTRCLDCLLPLLERHFKEEEDEIDGLHAIIQDQAPQHQNALQSLKDEHVKLLELARRYQTTARETEGHSTKLRELGTQLKNQLASHEARETEIFVDSIWTDLGVGD